MQAMAAGSSAIRGLLTQAKARAQGRGGQGGPGGAGPAIPDTEWHNYAGDLASTRHMPLDQINASNFDKLEMAWQFRTDSFADRVDAILQSTPLLAKGRLFSTGCIAKTREAGVVRAEVRATVSPIGPMETTSGLPAST
jgi:glucose dehydrogenase